MPTMPHLCPPYRAEHVGSLLRTPELVQKRGKLEVGECSEENVKKTAEEAIKEVIRLQVDAGLQTITDGELSRAVFYEGVFENLEGMTPVPLRPMSEWMSYIPHIAGMIAMGIPASETVYCSGKIKRTKAFYVDQFMYTKSLVPEMDVKNIKVTMCSPSWYHQRHGSKLTYDLSVYKNDDEYFDDLGVAYRAEISELYSLGCRHIQIDDPTFCFFCNEGTRESMRKAVVDPNVLLDTYIRAINVCTRERPSDLTVSVHMCRGNYKGMAFTEGPYDWIAEKVFNKLDVDAFYLEYDDSHRCGDFGALHHFPRDKTAVLGLVSTKTSALEDAEELKARVLEAAEAMTKGNDRSKEEALNQICLSTQCGFASVWEGNPLTIEDQQRKLSLLVKVAKEIWPETQS